MGSSIPTRIDHHLYAAAQAVAARHHRSAAQQIAHWAEIGRALEESPTVNLRAVERVLQGQAAYDDLGEREQAIVRATWDVEVDRRVEGLDLAQEFRAAGTPWVEADDEGHLIVSDQG